MPRKVGVSDELRTQVSWNLGVRFRTTAVRLGLTVRKALEQAVREWLERHEHRGYPMPTEESVPQSIGPSSPARGVLP